MAVASLKSTIRLNSGLRMPMVGLGCVAADTPMQTQRAVEAALEIGYRMIDTASVYENEADIGRALKNSPLPRQDIFLSTKVWNSDQGYQKTLDAFERSLDFLQTDYLDLYMLHWPLIRLRQESWRALEKLLADGRCRSIGVSNYAAKHLQEILDSSDVAPVVNQVEFNPYLNQRQLQEWCRRRDIQLVTHSPLARGTRRKNKVVGEIAERYGREPAQIVIRWALQRGVAVLSRAVDPEEILSHSQVFDLEISLKDMDALDGLHQNLRVGWDPTNAP